MPLVRITFNRCHQDSQNFGSTDDHMVSRVYFRVWVDGQDRGQFQGDLKQVVGSPFTSENIEVSPPAGYRGPFNYDEYAKAARDYYFDLAGPKATGIRFGAESSQLRMRDNVFEKERTVTFTASPRSEIW